MGCSTSLISVWLKKKTGCDQFERLPSEKLAHLFKDFYCTARTKNKQLYSKLAYENMHMGINSTLKSTPYNRNIHIVKNPEFRFANQVYDDYHVKIRTEGKDKSQHKSTIQEADSKKL